MASGVTLQESEKNAPDGFFPKLYENVCKTFTENDLNSMPDEHESNEKFIRYTCGLENFRTSLKICEFYPEKNPHESKIKREYGNKAYQNGKDIDALYLYTQAVISAPCDLETGKSKDLSVALANRSAVLFSLKAYPMALDDIRLALESGYPDELKFKLIDRKAKILMYFRQFSDAHSAYKELMKALDIAKVDAKKKMAIQKETQQAMEYFRKAPSIYNDPNIQIHAPKELPKISRRNPKYPAVSDAIEFRYEEGRGRYAVAARDVDVGEFICVENPIVSHMLPDFMGSNCTHCFKSMKAPLPCPRCTKVLFCSYKCRKVALETYHRYECTVVDFLIASGMSIICFLAYRCITQKPLKFFLDNKETFKQHDKTSGSNKSQVTKFLSDDYVNLYNLCTHRDQRKMNDIFHRAMFVVMMLRCLKKLGYFGEDVKEKANSEDETEVFTDDEIYIGTLLCHFLESMQFNAHEVAQFEMIARNTEEGSKSVFIGAAVYPTLAMCNHSCDPSIVRFYIESTVCVQAIKNIPKGEEICENYGPIFFHSDREDRQQRLKKQYWFDCQCIPCTENWPLMHEMSDDVLNFRCHECNGVVPFSAHSTNPLLRCVCGTPVEVLKALKAISETEIMQEKGKKAMEKGSLEEAYDLYTSYLTKLDKHLAPPYPDYYRIQQSIWKCIWMRFGNRVVRSKAVKPAVTADDYDTVD